MEEMFNMEEFFRYYRDSTPEQERGVGRKYLKIAPATVSRRLIESVDKRKVSAIIPIIEEAKDAKNCLVRTVIEENF